MGRTDMIRMISASKIIYEYGEELGHRHSRQMQTAGSDSWHMRRLSGSALLRSKKEAETDGFI